MPITGTYKIGSSAATVDSLSNLTVTGYFQSIPDPKGIYLEWSELVPKDSGGFRGVGYPKAIWKWNFMRPEWRDVLKAFCSGASAAVWIQTRTNSSGSSEFGAFTAIMNWPLEQDLDAHRRMNFIIEFTNLVSYTP